MREDGDKILMSHHLNAGTCFHVLSYNVRLVEMERWLGC